MTQKLYMGEMVTLKKGLAAIALSAGASNGDAIDRTGMMACKMHVSTGAATGTPTSFTVITKLQDSADGTTFADFTDPVSGSVPTVPTVTAVDSEAELAVNLLGARQYIRTVTTVAFVGGTTPTLVCAPLFVLGGADEEPAVAV